MGPNDSGKTQVLKAIERALRDSGESQSLVDLYGLTGPRANLLTHGWTPLADGVGHRLKLRDIAERLARRTHTLTDGAAFNTAEPARARPA
jgi:hypothetical protein